MRRRRPRPTRESSFARRDARVATCGEDAALREAEAAYHRRIPTAALNRLIQDAQTAHPAPPVRKSRPRVLYATQGAVDPPTFTLFVSHELPATYLRYLERRIREAFELGPTPIKVRVRKRS